jgi:hypothetical protein
LSDADDVVITAMDEGSHVMSKANLIALLIASALVSHSASAQNANEPEPGDEEAANRTDADFAAELLQAEIEYSALWDMRYPLELTPATDTWPESIAQVDFQDASLSGRMSRLRNLSLLTIGEFGKRRLFLGINSEGLVGIHLLGFSGTADQKYMEVVRMPYLGDDTASEDEVAAGTDEPRQAAPNH